MAKLTAEQKTANKLVAKTRSSAYFARRKVYELAQADALAAFHNEPLRDQMDAANDKFDAVRAQVQADRDAINLQIVQLQERLAGLPAVHNTEAINVARCAANTAYHQALAATRLAVKQAFPDVADVFSAVEWEARVATQDKGDTLTVR